MSSVTAFQRTALPLLLAAMAGACTAPSAPPCSAEFCPAGCCDAHGICQVGDQPSACGSSGAACLACGANQQCLLGGCVASGGGGGAAAGGGAGGGGGGGAGGGGCAAGLTACGAACVDTLTDPQHCGRCAAPCGATQLCTAGACVAAPADCRQTGQSCPASYYCNLADGRCLPGCAFDLGCPGANDSCDLASHQCTCDASFHECGGQCVANNAVASCGGRCSPCPGDPNGAATCDGTSCGISCNAGNRLCGGACAACPTANATSFSCAGSQCVASACAAGAHLCGGQCVANASVDSCGTTACTACPTDPNGASTCNGTNCGVSCNSGFRLCGACSACPTANATAFACSGTACVATTCAAGFHACGGSCVSNAATSTCGTSCTACATDPNGTATCNGTSCGITCAATFRLCGGACAACPTANATAFACSGAQCVASACAAGAHLCGGQCVSNAATATCGSSCTPCPLDLNGAVSCDGTSCLYACLPGFVGCATGCCPVISLAGGSDYTCAKTPAGAAKCWGSGHYFQLGTGNSATQLAPVGVAGLDAGVLGVAANQSPAYGTLDEGPHSCALTAGGGVKCWGENRKGQLGMGSVSSFAATPVDVVGLTSGVKAVAVGTTHTCALTSQGGVKCWGNNATGQLGDGTTVSRAQPTDVSGLGSGVVAVAVGAGHSCALMATGGLMCWGGNFSGALGVVGSTADSPVPVSVTVPLPLQIADLQAAYSHTCVLSTAGEVRCWGWSNWGEGQSVTVPGLRALSTSPGHTCAITADGGVLCWGSNGHGQLGKGAVDPPESGLPPVAVVGLTSGVVSIATGGVHTCAGLLDGGAVCWGANASYLGAITGQIGDGVADAGDRLTPSVVLF